MVTALALVCVRNESLHIRRCLGDLCRDGIDVVLLDNDSTDDTVAQARAFLGRGLLAIERLPWRGVFSLRDQLEAKQRIARAYGHDWLLHVDADEWLCATGSSASLLEGIAQADAAGYNCINFNEFVFVPLRGQNFETAEYAQLMTTYYFFEPYRPRLMRAWKRSSGLSNLAGSGHFLEGGEVRCWPHDFALRHYMMLSEEHGRRLYRERAFAGEELRIGMHTNRLLIPQAELGLDDAPPLRRLAHPSSRDFDTRFPVGKHFWEWGRDDAGGASARDEEQPADSRHVQH